MWTKESSLQEDPAKASIPNSQLLADISIRLPNRRFYAWLMVRQHTIKLAGVASHLTAPREWHTLGVSSPKQMPKQVGTHAGVGV